MGRRSRAHLAAARNLGHPIEGRQQKRRSPAPKKNSLPEHTLHVSAKCHKSVVLGGLTALNLTSNPGEALGSTE